MTGVTVPIEGEHPSAPENSAKWRAQAQAIFLRTYEETGIIRRGAEAAKVTPKTIWEWREKYPKFAEAFDSVAKIVVEMLQDAAVERALQKSDALLQFILAAKMPEVYGPRTRMELTGKDGEPIKSEHRGVMEADVLALMGRLDAVVSAKALPAKPQGEATPCSPS